MMNGRGAIGPAAALAVALALVAGWAGEIRAQSPQAPRAAAPSAADRCADRQRTLGVSRIVEIDTVGGPRFGHQQYKDVDFLEEGEIVLTFDDGPLRTYTQAIVDALEAQCTKATFFMVGSQALADPDMVRQIARKGHTVATHTWSHANLRQLNPVQARQEVELGFSAVSLALGQPTAPFFRFPFLADSRAMKAHLEQRGIAAFSIEMDALDYRNKDDPQAVHAEIMKQLAWHKKGILLFHDIQPSSARALPGLLAAIRARGFRVVHLRSKSTLATLPEFDAIARREMSAKRVAAAGNPLANRAVTWPQASKGTLPGATDAAPVAPMAKDSPPNRPSVPWAPPPQPTAAPPLPWATPPPPAPRPRPREEADWRRGVFAPN